MLKTIAKFDNRVSEAWTNHRFSPAFDKLLRMYARLGDGYGWALFIAFVIWKYDFAIFWEAVDHAMSALVVSLIIYFPLKNCTKRLRPYVANPKIQANLPPLDKYSFPSGHTMNNLAVASAVFFVIPESGWVMLLMPLSWGLLRVRYGVHWLTDVLCGFVLGIVSFIGGYGIWYAVTSQIGIPLADKVVQALFG